MEKIEPNENIIEKEEQLIFPFAPYRGIKPFRYLDHTIFAAREWEKEQLLDLVTQYRGSLLYGPSGIGKSSLVNAGLIPLLKKNNFQPEVIRVCPNREGTFIIYRIALNDDLHPAYFPSLFDVPQNEQPEITISFEKFKRIVFEQKYSGKENQPAGIDNGPVPVLIFDQFEELITLFEEVTDKGTEKEKMSFKERAKFQSDVIELFKNCYYDQLLRVKLLFIFREDYLAKFSKLFRVIPDLRDHTLRTKAVSKPDIYRIVQCPFADDKRKNSYKDSFTGEQIDAISRQLKQYFGEGSAVLTDIQIVCQYLYESPQQRNQLLNSTGPDPIAHIIQLFYKKMLASFPDQDKLLAVDVLSLLVLNEHTRNIFHEDAIIEQLKSEYNSELIRKVLVKLDTDTRLVRSEIRPGGTYYEINSESLIPYINSLKVQKEKKQAIKKSRKRLLLTISIVLFILLPFLLIVTYSSYNKLKQEKEFNKQNQFLFAAAVTQNQNPTLSYLIAREGYNINISNDKLNSLIENFNKTKSFEFITAVINYPENIIGAFFKSNDTIGIVSNHYLDYFTRDGLLLEEKLFQNIIYADVAKGYIINRRKQGISADTNQLCNLDGKVIRTFISYPLSPRIFAISANGRSLLVENDIYKTGETKPSAQLEIPNECKDLMAATFTSDGKHIIAGFWSGHAIVYDLKGKMIKAFVGGAFNSVITCLAVTDDSKYLVIGGRNNDVRLFKLGNLDSISKSSLDSIKTEKGAKIYFGQKEGPQITSITTAPDKITFISCEENKSIVLDTNLKKLKVLTGHKENVLSAVFSRDQKQILTYTGGGKVYIWNQGPVYELYEKKSLVTFSPIDYRTAGIEKVDCKSIYKDTSNSNNNLFKVINNYSALLPYYGVNTEDSVGIKLLNESLFELSELYQRQLQFPKFDHLSSLNKKLLFRNYSKFREDSTRLVQDKYENDSAVLERIGASYFWKGRSLLVDTTDISAAISIAKVFEKVARFFSDSTYNYNYKRAVHFLDNGIELLNAFKTRNSNNSDLKNELATLYGNLSWYSLFIKDFSGSRTAAVAGLNTGKEFSTEFEWINTNLALAYLLNKNFEMAEKVYQKYKRTLRESFLDDFDELEQHNIIPSNDMALTIEIQKIKKMLK